MGTGSLDQLFAVAKQNILDGMLEAGLLTVEDHAGMMALVREALTASSDTEAP